MFTLNDIAQKVVIENGDSEEKAKEVFDVVNNSQVCIFLKTNEYGANCGFEVIVLSRLHSNDPSKYSLIISSSLEYSYTHVDIIIEMKTWESLSVDEFYKRYWTPAITTLLNVKKRKRHWAQSQCDKTESRDSLDKIGSPSSPPSQV